MKKEFTTYQPATISPNSITNPSCFNGMCLIREYRVTVEEIKVPDEVLKERLMELSKRDVGHSSNYRALEEEAKKLGVEL